VLLAFYEIMKSSICN